MPLEIGEEVLAFADFLLGNFEATLGVDGGFIEIAGESSDYVSVILIRNGVRERIKESGDVLVGRWGDKGNGSFIERKKNGAVFELKLELWGEGDKTGFGKLYGEGAGEV